MWAEFSEEGTLHSAWHICICPFSSAFHPSPSFYTLVFAFIPRDVFVLDSWSVSSMEGMGSKLEGARKESSGLFLLGFGLSLVVPTVLC
jgi:hypothetical protein